MIINHIYIIYYHRFLMSARVIYNGKTLWDTVGNIQGTPAIQLR